MGYFSFQLKAFLEGNSALLQSVHLMFRHYLMTLIMSLLLPGISHSQDTLICDNGGFEDDFDFYFGDTSTYSFGGNICEVLDNSLIPVPFGNISLPASFRFEIVGSGSDPLVGIDRVKFGSKSILLNNKNGHFGFCAGTKDVNRLR
jgi:hypothetical protein